MALAHTWTLKVAIPGLPALPADAPVVISGSSDFDVEVSCPAGQTTQINVPTVAAANMISFVLNADQANVTVNTNAADATGGQSFALAAAKTLGWNNTMAFANPITIDITSFYVINSAAKATNFRFGVLYT